MPEGIKNYKPAVTNYSQDVKYSIVKIINNILIITYGVRDVVEISGGPYIKYMIV